MGTQVTNFGKVTVSTSYGSGDTSIVLTSGHGSRLPTECPFPLTWWDATTYSDPADDPQREIVLVTVRVTDTVTVLRGQEGTSASTKNTAGKTYKMVLGITAAMWTALGDLSLSETFRGLHVQPGPDLADQTSTITLNASAIVMSDGEEVPNWVNVVFDKDAANGVGGLDTGSDVASTWYELHAVWNGTTKGVIGHRAKDWFFDEEYATGEDASQGVRSNVDNSTVKVAQGFKVDVAGPIPFVDVKLIKTGAPTDEFWFTIEATSSGVPNNTPLATSRKYSAGRVITTATWCRIVFDTPVSVSAATQYHLVMQGNYAVSGTNFLSWRMDGSAATYANGAKALYDSDTATWTTDTDDDLLFRVFVTENDTPVTLPAGYRAALVSYFYVDSGNAILFFQQMDHEWRYESFQSTANQVVDELAATTTLYDVRQWFPPRVRQLCRFALTGTGSATADCVIGDITQLNCQLTSASTYQVFIHASLTTETDVSGTSEAVILTGGAIMADSTAGADLYAVGFTL